MHYRHRPTLVEAIQFIPENYDAILLWLRAELGGHRFGMCPDNLNIQTIEGDRDCPYGYWVIKGVAGEFYPVHPDVFARAYEPADNSGYLPRHATPAGAR